MLFHREEAVLQKALAQAQCNKGPIVLVERRDEPTSDEDIPILAHGDSSSEESSEESDDETRGIASAPASRPHFLPEARLRSATVLKAEPRKLLSSLPLDEQAQQLKERFSPARLTLSQRRASKIGPISRPATCITPPVPSPGTPSLTWTSAVRKAAAPTPSSPLVVRCGGVEIRITPPTPRPIGAPPFKVPGVVLRHAFAPPPQTPGSRSYKDEPTLAVPPFDVAPGRNMILQRRAELQLAQLREMAHKNDSSGASSPGLDSPKPLPKVCSPLSAAYRPPGSGGYRHGQLSRRVAASQQHRRAPAPPPTPSSAPVESVEKRHAGRLMLTRLGQRSVSTDAS